MLERLSAEEEDTEDYLAAPPLGKHYTLRWAEEDDRADPDSGEDTDGQTASNGTAAAKT